MRVFKIIFMCVFIVCTAIFFWRLIEKEDGVADKALVHSEKASFEEENIYYIKAKNGNIVIYNNDNTVYEYTDLDPEFLPEDVTEELLHGIYFQNQEDLYEFLETYSS